MSSSRSVASARAKRAGLSNEQIPNKTNFSNITQNNSSETITIPNAITLITLRLGKLETYVQSLETDILPTLYNQPSNNLSSSTPINTNLEEQINKLSTKISQIELENITLKNKLNSLEERLPNVQEIITNNLPQVQEIIKSENILPQIQEINNEIIKIKDLLMYLQHNSLEINEKIIHVLLEKTVVVEKEIIEEEEEVVKEVVKEVVEEVVEEVVKVIEEEVVEKDVIVEE